MMKRCRSAAQPQHPELDHQVQDFRGAGTKLFSLLVPIIEPVELAGPGTGTPGRTALEGTCGFHQLQMGSYH